MLMLCIPDKFMNIANKNCWHIFFLDVPQTSTDPAADINQRRGIYIYELKKESARFIFTIYSGYGKREKERDYRDGASVNPGRGRVSREYSN